MIKLTVISFGFKYGPFAEANMLYDVRGFKNPYYVDELRNGCGMDSDVYEYVFSDAEAEKFYKASVTAAEISLARWAELEREGFVLAYGCTGGQHRSVAFAKRAAEYFESLGYDVILCHRNLGESDR